MERMNLFGGNDKSSEASFENNTPKELTALPPAPIQDKNGNLIFTLEGETYSLNVNSEKEREKVKREVNINNSFSHDNSSTYLYQSTTKHD